MKAKLLKKFRKRFEIITFGKNSLALLDHKDERVIYNIVPGRPIRCLSDAIVVGVSKLEIGFYQHLEFIKTRRKRMYHSHLTKK